MQIVRELKLLKKEIGIICIIGYLISVGICISFGNLINKSELFSELFVPLIIAFVCSKFINLQMDVLKDILKGSIKSYIGLFALRYIIICSSCIIVEAFFLMLFHNYFQDDIVKCIFISVCTSIYISTIGVVFSHVCKIEYIGAIVAGIFSIFSLVTNALIRYPVFKILYPYPLLNGVIPEDIIWIEIGHLLLSSIMWGGLIIRYKK